MTRRRLPLLLPGLLLALPAWPASGAQGQEVSVGVSSVTYASFFRTRSRLGLGVAYGQPIGPGGAASPWSVQAGLRAGLPDVRTPLPLELFARLELRVVLGAWEPAVGPEVGVSGLSSLATRNYIIFADFAELEQQRVSPFYFAFALAPLRLRFGAVRVSALELHVGTTLVSPGTAARLHLELLKVGVSL